ncbi:uncharacterized protein LOC124290508 isoform X2 [Haliotis rubra]|uniref:uncharacterized protein LOC124290508 isoform X2 n=1 Tax=Haliotis rubra TaxID=36100 RepID=UPI001EE5DA6A|nr:uncharacterized protein LOC124290508 isoform X2 [Haliotis rubra]
MATKESSIVAFLFLMTARHVWTRSFSAVPTGKCANGLYLDTALARCKYCNEHCPWVGFQAIPQACSTYCLTSTTAPTTTTPPKTKTGVPLNTPAIIAICLACGICVTGIVGLLWMFVPACQTTRKTPFQRGYHLQVFWKLIQDTTVLII